MSEDEKQCQRYFAVGKRVSKDVKRHCTMCRQHGVLVATRGHRCLWENCQCTKCFLIRQRREIMSTQIRLRREQDKHFQRTSEPAEATVVPKLSVGAKSSGGYPDQRCKTQTKTKSACYICQKCKNHGILVWKKDHKKHCRYRNCSCAQCELIEKRRKLDQNLKNSGIADIIQNNMLKISSLMMNKPSVGTQLFSMYTSMAQEQANAAQAQALPQQYANYLNVFLPVTFGTQMAPYDRFSDFIPNQAAIASYLTQAKLQACSSRFDATSAMLNAAGNPNNPLPLIAINSSHNELQIV